MNDLFSDDGATFDVSHKFRYKLWRIWDSERPKITFIGLNPSTADQDTNDPTMRRLINFCSRNNYGGLYMTNLFSVIATDSKELKQLTNPVDYPEIKNTKTIYTIQDCAKLSDKVVFCWGRSKYHPSMINHCLKIIETFPDAYCFGFNSDGSPKHPLYLKNEYMVLKKYKLKFFNL